jgi:hypothetical protein
MSHSIAEAEEEDGTQDSGNSGHKDRHGAKISLVIYQGSWHGPANNTCLLMEASLLIKVKIRNKISKTKSAEICPDPYRERKPQMPDANSASFDILRSGLFP